MTQDKSENFEETYQFLTRRLKDVKEVGHSFIEVLATHNYSSSVYIWLLPLFSLVNVLVKGLTYSMELVRQ